MKNLFVAVLALGLAACAMQAPQRAAVSLEAEHTTSGINTYAIGTLAPLGSFEWKAAPAYTRLAVLRHNAAVSLRAGRINVDDAETIQSRADHIRSLLDAAIKADAQHQTPIAEMLLQSALDQLATANNGIREK